MFKNVFSAGIYTKIRVDVLLLYFNLLDGRVYGCVKKCILNYIQFAYKYVSTSE